MKKYIYIITSLIVLSCSSDSSDTNNTGNSETGQAGSLARFVILNDYLYTVDNNDLNVFSISDPENPVQVNSVPIGFNIETLFNYNQYLYIGSRNGMFIYGVSNPELPDYLSDVQHFTACDPIVANNTHAFVTLHADIGCGNTVNSLEVYDVTNVTDPIFISSRNLTNPIGMGLYNNYLFVCDDEVKIFDISDIENITLATAINKDAFDVIIQNNLLILIGENGLFQYSLDQDDINNIQELSTINI